jgi:hypothetical protein
MKINHHGGNEMKLNFLAASIIAAFTSTTTLAQDAGSETDQHFANLRFACDNPNHVYMIDGKYYVADKYEAIRLTLIPSENPGDLAFQADMSVPSLYCSPDATLAL